MKTVFKPKFLVILLVAGLLAFFHTPLVLAANGELAALSLPATLSVGSNRDFDVPITLNTDGASIRGVDVILNFDRTRLSLVSITPNAQSGTNLNTFLPVDGSGNFNSSQIISTANSSSRIEFGAVTFNWLGGLITTSYNGTTILATLRFHPLQAGPTSVSFNFQPGSTTTNITQASTPPKNLLTNSNQLTNSTLTITAIPTVSPTTGGPTPTSIPTLTPLPPNPPIISTTPSCISPGYSGSGIVITWTNPSTPVSWVDLSTSLNFTSFYHKAVSNTTSTTAPSGFNGYLGLSGPLTLNPNVTYFVRVFNGANSQPTSYNLSACVTPTPTPTVSPTGGPTPTRIPTPTPTPTVTPAPTPTPIPTPTPVPCRLTSASWSVPLTRVIEGTPLTLNITTAGECSGKTASLTVWEDDGLLGRDSVKVNPSPLILSASPASTTWIAEFQLDGPFGLFSPPEYYFEASLAGGNNLRSDAPNISVDPSTSLKIITTPLIQVASNSATISWDTNNNSTAKVELRLPGDTEIRTFTPTTISVVTSHTVELPGLHPCATYNYKLEVEANTEQNSFNHQTITTAGCTANAPVVSQNFAQIEATAGGKVDLKEVSPAKGLDMDVPANFATSSGKRRANFQLKKLSRNQYLSAISLPSGRILVGDHLYQLMALTDLSGDLTSFDQPITITISYLPEEVSAVNENTLIISRYDGSAWHSLPDCQFNTQTKTAACTTMEFSDFALLAEPLPTPTPPASGQASQPQSGGGGGGGGDSGGGGGGGGGGPAPQTADINGSGRVDIFDLSILLRNWGRGGQGDLNGSGKVDIFDLSILLRSWSR